MISSEKSAAPDQVRGRLFRDHALLRFRLVGTLRAEIDVNRLADDERSGIRQIDDDLENVDIAELARTARVDPSRADDAGDRRDLSFELTVAKCGGAHQDLLSDAHSC